MKHLGDITKISGYDAPIVDIITGGSPCQDLSVAGKRAGLDGERSGLFMEQVRIVKEMRERDRNNGRTDESIRPRYMVWENVCGAFSSNGGKDFQAVLTEITRIAEPNAPDVPMPDKGRWNKSGCLYDDLGKWSIAWRVHDAQFWGVPQRRKRISVVADFGGESAPEILFERKGLSRDIAKSGKEWQGITTTAEKSIGKAISFQERAGKPGGGKGILIQDERTGALSTLVAYANEAYDKWSESEKSATLRASGGVYGGGSESLSVGHIVCKLTPLECERLQGFPDGWTDIGDWIDSKGKKHKGESDSPRYKALGNSIALPFWQWLAKRIVSTYDRKTTMASLFDGIGGFPLVFSRCGCQPIWASEIEEFPIAVTKTHFPEEG